MTRLPRVLFAALVFGLVAGPPSALAQQPLDHDVYTIWNRIEARAISGDGRWALWEMAPEEADGKLVVRATDRDERFEIERGSDARFARDGRHVVFLVEPEFAAARQARIDDVDEAERPQPALGILALEDGAQTRVERVASFALPAESGDWLAYQLGPVPDAAPADDDGIEDESAESDEASDREDEHDPGTTLVVRSLRTDARFELEHVGHYAWTEDGSRLAFTRVSPDGADDGLFVVDPAIGEPLALATGEGQYGVPVFDASGQRLAFVARRRDAERAEHAFTLFSWQAGGGAADAVADETADFLPAGWHVSEHREPLFSDDGRRLYFGTAPAPAEIPDNDDRLDDEVVTVDIWHWQDELLQPMQLERLEDERKRSYLAVAHLDDAARLVQLGRQDVPEVVLAEDGGGTYALGYSNQPYRRAISWDYPRYYDAYRIDVETGAARRVAEAVQDRPALSPGGTYAFWWARDRQTWQALRLADRTLIDLGQGVDHPLQDHTNDRPFAADGYGQAGWLKADAAFVFYDRHDIWRVDPERPEQPLNLSQGKGREDGRVLRLVDLSPDDAALDPGARWLATVFDEQTKAHGFFELFADARAPVERIVSDHHYGQPFKAEDAPRLLLTRENYREFPDLWTADLDFGELERLSAANPQQADYRWGRVEQLEWQSTTGKDHQGLLYTPDDFDAERTYPMIVYFYERHSDRLHRHYPPQAHRSVIIPTFYNSNGYVVFVPDVWYREGYPGDSAMESIMPMVERLADQPWIDAGRVGIQGHSWAGYQIAYMVTQTDFFRAAAGGAPVANMTSAYGGIRWRTGMSRMFQYERTQSRLGQTLWEDRELYLHNSPLFMADRINTPLLMMHNDQDGAVPWEQGIELFVALRRLERPAWLINYNDEPHWPTTFANRRDWQIRLQQYFDHYLKDEPAPRWLREGIPALEKGATLGHETDGTH